MYELVSVMCMYMYVYVHMYMVYMTPNKRGGSIIIIMYIQIRFAKKVSWRLLCAYIVHP